MGEGFEVFGRDEGAETADLAAGDPAVDGAPDTNEEEEPTRVTGMPRWEKVSDESTEQANAAIAEFL